MFRCRRPWLTATAVVFAASTSLSHAAPAVPATAVASPSPYAGEEVRDIKALSPQEVRSLLEGRGMGFAKAAELNGYPGPAHVLELGDQLALSADQRRRTRALFAAMEREAMALGRELVSGERELERLFASGTINQQSLQQALLRNGELQARLRGVHLQAHIEQVKILDALQVEQYSALRGYGGGHGAHGDGARAGNGERDPHPGNSELDAHPGRTEREAHPGHGDPRPGTGPHRQRP